MPNQRVEALFSKKGRIGASTYLFLAAVGTNEERKLLSPLLTYFGGARLVENMERCRGGRAGVLGQGCS